jgi:hypothetical protein
MIRQRFFLPVIFFVLVMLVLGIAQSSVEAASYSRQDAQSLLSAFMSYADLRILSVQQSLEILASTTEVRSGKWGNMEDLLRSYQQSDEGLVVWYVRPDGTYYTGDKGLIDKTLSDRSYFPDLISGKKITGALVISKSTGQRSAVIAVPVKKDGKVVGAVGTSLFLDKLSVQIDVALDLPPDVTFFALAPNGLTTLNRKTDLHFLDPREVGSETLKKAANEMLSETAGKTTYKFDNVTKHALYRTSALTQWKFAIAFSTAPQK